MNGLLDPATLALMAAGGGLLQAGGPSRTPVSLGQAMGGGLLQGLNTYQGAVAANRQASQTEALIALEKQKAAQLEQQLNAAKAAEELKKRLLKSMGYGDDGTPPPPTQTASAGDTSAPSSVMYGSGGERPSWLPASPMQIPQAPQQQQAFPFNPSQIAALRVAGMPDLTGAYNASRPDVEVKDGVMYDKRSGRVLGTIPTMNAQGFSTQLMQDGRGGWTVGVTPGAERAFGTQQGISERTRAGFDPFMGVQDAAGRPIPMTREGFAVNYGNAGTTGGIQTPRPAPAGTGPTPAAREAAVTAGKGDASRVLELEAKIPNQLSVIRRLDRMEQLTANDTTYAAAGAELKTMLGSIAQGFGLPVKQEKTGNAEEYLAHVAELLKDRLASKDYGSGSGVSNVDIIAARAPLPEIAKTSTGRQQLIQALRADAERNLKDAQAARDYFDANTGLRGFRFPSEVAAEKEQRRRDLPKTPGSPGTPIPGGVTVRRLR